MTKRILVTGATGAQGGALIPLLLEKGFRVRALTRDPAKASAQALARQGVEVVAGDLDDEASLHRACSDCDGVFSVQNFWEKGVGHAREVEQGCKLARAAKQAGVSHFVQTSVANCDAAAGVLHFESKHKIEQYIDSLGLPRTFLREVFFMENFTQPVMTSGAKKSMSPFWVLPTIIGLLDPGTRFHMISVADIAWFAADVFEHPEQFIGQELDVAGDVLTAAEMKAVYRKVTGRRLPPVSRWLMRLMLRLVNPESARQFQWNNQQGWNFDIAPLQRRHAGLRNFEGFLRHHYGTRA
ncbi:MAG: NmrA/HSCARG family protein [Pseudomonadota bacterium]|nr:NmrA/HSCARG family protein [Pseudomonadota bacterium]